LDQKSLLKLWEEDERILGGRSKEELEFYPDNGSWPEAKGRLHYLVQGGKLFVEWRGWPEKKDTELGSHREEREDQSTVLVFAPPGEESK
jgi:hypothetical protein